MNQIDYSPFFSSNTHLDDSLGLVVETSRRKGATYLFPNIIELNAKYIVSSPYSANVAISNVTRACETSRVKMQISKALTSMGADRATRTSTKSALRVGGLRVHTSGGRQGLERDSRWTDDKFMFNIVAGTRDSFMAVCRTPMLWGRWYREIQAKAREGEVRLKHSKPEKSVREHRESISDSAKGACSPSNQRPLAPSPHLRPVQPPPHPPETIHRRSTAGRTLARSSLDLAVQLTDRCPTNRNFSLRQAEGGVRRGMRVGVGLTCSTLAGAQEGLINWAPPSTSTSHSNPRRSPAVVSFRPEVLDAEYPMQRMGSSRSTVKKSELLMLSRSSGSNLRLSSLLAKSS
ncbi:hypothetical protein BJ912DRAFT_1111530 [Pholiota molesta]|nr:hypothetical protein BJ912DRAFT_1111530 [Pholiota molesta]